MGMRQLSPRRYPTPTSTHPIREFGNPADLLVVQICGSMRFEFSGVRSWAARAYVPDYALRYYDASKLPPCDRSPRDVAPLLRVDDAGTLARMRLYTVKIGEPQPALLAANDVDPELGEVIASAIDIDNEPLLPVRQAIKASSRQNGWTPDRLLVLQTFAVHPRWTGTGFTPYLAAMTLSKFASLGSDAVLLHAHPVLFGKLARESIAAVQRKIIKMYRLLGFEQYDDEGHMAGWFPRGALDDFLDDAPQVWSYLEPARRLSRHRQG